MVNNEKLFGERLEIFNKIFNYLGTRAFDDELRFIDSLIDYFDAEIDFMDFMMVVEDFEKNHGR